jgi:5-methyltetrahydropteroyltriglutamate--homocysteine methyltransferase
MPTAEIMPADGPTRGKPGTRPPFHADHVGSLLRPPKLIAARKAFETGAFPRAELRGLEDEAIDEAIAMQERVGLKSVTDGEMRRLTWRDGFFESVDGFSTERVASSFVFTEFSGEKRPGIPVPRVAGILQRRKPITADDFSYLAKRTTRMAKATLPSPSVNHFFAGDATFVGSPYADRRAYLADVAAIYRQELADLAAAGCNYLQMDEVALAIICDPMNRKTVQDRGENPDQLIRDYVGTINDAIRDRPAGMSVCVHMCKGNGGLGQGSGGYEPVADVLFNELNVDGYLMEFDTERAGSFAPLALVPKGKMVLLGMVSTKLRELEDADYLKRRVEAASRHIDVRQLGICPQCGFASSFLTDRFTFDDQERKLAHLVKVADEIWG